jgi:hypothetical protein
VARRHRLSAQVTALIQDITWRPTRPPDRTFACPFLHPGSGVVPATHPTQDGHMTSSAHLATAGLRQGDVATALRVADLEEFWPSRRGHAFDEFCR